MKGYCYLIHFDNPINPAFPAQHYLGWAKDYRDRFGLHAASEGARLCQVAIDRGIGFRLARIWRNKDRHFERALKNRHNAPKLCPCCQGKKPHWRLAKLVVLGDEFLHWVSLNLDPKAIAEQYATGDPTYQTWLADGAPVAKFSNNGLTKAAQTDYRYLEFSLDTVRELAF